MAQREVVALNESVPQLQVPQSGDTYLLPRSTQLSAAADLVFAEKADHSETPAAGYGYLWVKNTSPSGLIFTDDAGTDHSLVVEDFIATLSIAVVANQDYVLLSDMPFGGTITTLRTKTQSGTCTVTGKVNTTALGGTANSASSSAQEQAHATANTFAKGDTLKITISSNSAALGLVVHFSGTVS